MNVPNKPWMSQQEIDLILSFLSKDDVMLEYGCGGSTMYFPHFVKNYYSIESDINWSKSVKSRMPENVEMFTIPVVRPEDREQKLITEWSQLYTTRTYFEYKEYIEAGSKVNETISRLLIDGRARPQCARYMYDFLGKDSIVFLHDWHPTRQHYRTVLERYKIIQTIDNGQCLAVLTKK